MNTKLILVLLLLSGLAFAQPKKGVHDGITVSVDQAQFSKNGKLVIVTATATEGPGGFVLVCDRTDGQGHCAFPKVAASYRVVSVTENGQECWGLVAVEGKEPVNIFTLVYAGAK